LRGPGEAKLHSIVGKTSVTPEMAKAGRYRPDIDGLRAIAVLSVVIFHAFPTVLRSGFVGVDIFFVISGYLITSIILNSLANERFSFSTFYARRIRRIFPALLAALSACIIAGWFLLLPDEYTLLGTHLIAGAGFLSNVEMLREANYFDAAADTKILLHLWSLGIEEQYYLVWPAVVWAAWRYGLRLYGLFIVLFACSFIYSVEATRSNPVVAFYSPLARFWELGLGGILSLGVIRPLSFVALCEYSLGAFVRTLLFDRGRGGDNESNYRGLLSVLGLSLIIASIVSITRVHEFPGWWALMPTVGAYLTILAGPSAWLNRTVLSNRVLVWFGLISYPLYLWHWPLLAFARNVLGDTPPLPLRAGIVVASIILAWLTYRLIERPIRSGFRRPWVVPVMIAAMVTVGAIGVVNTMLAGFPNRLGEKAAYAWYFNTGSKLIQAEYNNYISQNRCNFYNWNATIPTLVPRSSIDPDCYTRHSSKSVMIIGDSNASDLYYGLHEVLPKDISLLLIWSSGCQVSPVIERIIAIHHCNMANYFEIQRIKADPPDVLLLSSNNSFDIAYIRQFAAMAKGYGVKRVLVLGQRPHWKSLLYKVILNDYWPSIPRYIAGHLDNEMMSFTKTFQSQLQPDELFEFVDEMQPFCNADGCLTYLGSNPREGLITSDTVHLRPFASVWLAQQQLAPLILRDMTD
jgi:peptidoglycan/LPS O-acetylase OafA/YrhL